MWPKAFFSAPFQAFRQGLFSQGIDKSRFAKNHKIFDKQAKTATTNGVFAAKKPQINIVRNERFFYYIYNSSATRPAGF
jgi:hypothetical protein